MKFLVVAFICYACIASGLADDAEDDKFKMECAKESGVAEDVLGKWKQGEVADDAKLDDFFLCFMKKMGVMNDAGDFQLDVIKQKVSSHFGDEVGEKIAEECTKDKADTPEKAAHNLAKCYTEHIPKAAK